MKPTEFINDVKGFALSAALLAAMEHDVFQELIDDSKTTEDLCRSRQWDERVGKAVLDVLEANGYLIRSGDEVSLGASASLIMGSYAELRSWAKEMSLTYESLADLPKLLTTGDTSRTALSKFWAYKSEGGLDDLAAKDVAPYSEVMERSQESHALAVLSVLDLGPYRTLVDLGGGYGGFARQAIRQAPALTVIVVDLPAVVEQALSEGFDKNSERIRFHGCDAFVDDLPKADAVIFNRVLHDWSDDDATGLLERARRAIGQEGKVFAAENIDPESTDLTPSTATTRLMLTMLGGKRRTLAEMESLFDAANLELTEVLPTSHSLTTVLVGSPRLTG